MNHTTLTKFFIKSVYFLLQARDGSYQACKIQRKTKIKMDCFDVNDILHK